MASDSSPSTTPVLTPDSTGGSPDSSGSPAKKSRRQAYYPPMNSNRPLKPFSRSAAKRESVMALGSIEHLQHYFTKTGIAAKKNPLSKNHQGLVPAIGGPTHVRTSPSISSPFVLPPSPEVPTTAHPAFSPHIKNYDTDPESLLPGVVDDLAAVVKAWDLESGNGEKGSEALADPVSDKPAGPLDILGVLKITTRAIRSIRNYLLALPDESAGTIRANFRPHNLGPGKPHQNAVASSSTQPDPLTLIRRSAVEVLTVLREMEENCRLPLSDDAYDAQSDGGTSRGGGPHSQMTSPDNKLAELPDDSLPDFESHGFDPDSSVTFVQVQGRYGSVPVWEDEDEDSLSEEEEKEKKEHWDERLVVGSGWLYRQDVTLSELPTQKKMVEAYLDLVDQVLFGGKKDDQARERGWERVRRKAVEKGDRGAARSKARRVSAGDASGKTLGVFTNREEGKRRVSTGMLDMMGGMSLTEEPEGMGDIKEDEEAEESVDDEELPDWAQRSTFLNDDLGRAHAMISTFLPSRLLPALEPSSPRTAFLASLSSGQLLCTAYNSCVRKSRQPWGYVNKDGIHDIIALEKAEADSGDTKAEGGKKGWTFRRIDNLRLWVGALKLRYMLHIQVPTQPIASAAGMSSPARATRRTLSAEPSIVFDAKVVARKDDGWEDMLESVLLKWVWKAVDERRSVR